MPRPPLQRREDTLHACMMTFWQHGYAATSMRQIEQATGLKPSSIYHAFGSKEALFNAALQYYLDTVIGDRIRHYLQRDTAIMQGITDFMLSAFATREPAFPVEACLLVKSSAELGMTTSATHRVIQTGLQRVNQALHTALQHAAEAGELRSTAQPDQLALQLGLMLPGLILSARHATPLPLLQQQVIAVLAPWSRHTLSAAHFASDTTSSTQPSSLPSTQQ